MKVFVAVILLGTIINNSTSMIYTGRIYEVSSSGVPNFPEFVARVELNDIEVMRCDSVTKKFEPKQSWMNRVTEDDPHFWEWTSNRCLHDQQVDKESIENVKQHFNQTEGAHLWQTMFGCQWNDETDEVTGYMQYAFDGEDFISLDMSTDTWVTAKSQAFSTKLRWERRGYILQVKHFIDQICINWLKKIVRYGEDTLKRTVLPVVSLLQTSPSSPVTCHATGFYPERALLFWTKDGNKLQDIGENLPNGNGTFQSFVDLDVSSVPPEDWGRFSCVFQLSGVKEDLITKLEQNKIRTNAKSTASYVAGIVVFVVFVVFVVAVAVFIWRKGKTNPQNDSQDLRPAAQVTTSGGSSTSSQEDQERQRLNPEAAEAQAPEEQ